jgi:thiamine pyrophosphokinase
MVKPTIPTNLRTHTAAFACDHLVLVSGGASPLPQVLPMLGGFEVVIAVDSGYQHAKSLGLTVDVLIGDFDSLPPEQLEHARTDGITVIEHPAEKDATDLELALELAIAHKPRALTIISGGTGDRFDHLIAEVALLTHPLILASSVEHIRAYFHTARIDVLRGPSEVTLAGEPGGYVSLLAIDHAVSGIFADGLRYPLNNDVLQPHSTRGISNELLGPNARISIGDGTLLVVVPHAIPKARES